jgi:hypothetical protein
MEEIKIGDIVQPYMRRGTNKYIPGLVVATKQAKMLPVTVVFPTENGPFTVRDFRENHLIVITCTPEERKEIVEAGYEYRQLQLALSRA